MVLLIITALTEKGESAVREIAAAKIPRWTATTGVKIPRKELVSEKPCKLVLEYQFTNRVMSRFASENMYREAAHAMMSHCHAYPMDYIVEVSNGE